MNKEEKL